MSIFQKYGLIFLTMAILLPSVLKLSHIYAHEKHTVCVEYNDLHIHKKQLDCELCKLHYTPFFKYELFTYELVNDVFIDKKFFNNYLFLSEYQKLSYSLRGPPQRNFTV